MQRKIGKFDGRLRDIDEWHSISAIADRRHGHDLIDMFEHVGRNMRKNTSVAVMYGYVVPPQSTTESVGMRHPDTAAWLLLDENGPALIFRKSDTELMEYIEHWLKFWLDNPAPARWMPATKESAKLWVPVDMAALNAREKRLSPRQRRMMRNRLRH